MIIQNAIFVPKLDKYFKSAHTHDFVSFKINGQEGFIDGGNDYFRAGGIACNLKYNKLVKDWSLDENSSIKEILNKLLWGIRIPDGKQPLTYLPIKDLELDHLKQILKVYSHPNELSPLHSFVISYWIEQKKYEERKQKDKDFLNRKLS